MKKLILFLLLGIFLVSFVSAEECELALPRYGVIECYDMGDIDSVDIPLEHGTEISTGSFACVSDCDLNTLNLPEVSCGFGWGTHWEIYKNDNLEYEESAIEGRYEREIHLDYGDELGVLGYCSKIIGKDPLPIDKIIILQRVVMLREGWAGSLPTKTHTSTKGCILNIAINDDTDITSYLEINSGEQKNKEPSTYDSLSEFPTNWKVGDNYIFVKDWQTGIADISLTYDKDNNAYWCGGESGNRKIYNVDPIHSSSGKCYSIPKSIALSNVECCEDVDCLNLGFGAKYVCNPDNWKCEQTKPCNSQLDCESVFGEGICENHEINKWICDMNKKWGNYAGTCVNTIEAVSQCPVDCSNNEYYNEEEGKCKSLKKILDCPSEKCCLSGGSYKEKLCGSGLQCCTLSGSFVGACAEDCSQISEEYLEGGITGEAISASKGKSSSTGTIILIVFLVLIGGSIAYYFYTNKKKTTPKKGVKKELETKGKHCTKCGSKLKPQGKFCSKCGRRI